MAGRVREFFMSPLLLSELLAVEGYAGLKEKRDSILQHGLYPQVFDPSASVALIEENLSTLA